MQKSKRKTKKSTRYSSPVQTAKIQKLKELHQINLAQSKRMSIIMNFKKIVSKHKQNKETLIKNGVNLTNQIYFRQKNIKQLEGMKISLLSKMTKIRQNLKSKQNLCQVLQNNAKAPNQLEDQSQPKIQISFNETEQQSSFETKEDQKKVVQRRMNKKEQFYDKSSKGFSSRGFLPQKQGYIV